LLAAEITAKMKKDPGEIYVQLTRELGDPLYERTEAPATSVEKTMLERMTKESVQVPNLAGEKIRNILTNAPGDGQPIGGVKVMAESGWFAARPSGTEEIYKIYAESFNGKQHLQQIEAEAQVIVRKAFESTTFAT
jgi:phosphoglucomutase